MYRVFVVSGAQAPGELAQKMAEKLNELLAEYGPDRAALVSTSVSRVAGFGLTAFMTFFVV